jgi:hypothetical protein
MRTCLIFTLCLICQLGLIWYLSRYSDLKRYNNYGRTNWKGSGRKWSWYDLTYCSIIFFRVHWGIPRTLLKRLYKTRKPFAHDYVGMLRCSYAVTPETCSCHFSHTDGRSEFLWDLNGRYMVFNWFNVGTIQEGKYTIEIKETNEVLNGEITKGRYFRTFSTIKY